MLLRNCFFAAAALLSIDAYGAKWELNFTGKIDDITEYLGDISNAGKGDYNFHGDRYFLGQDFSGYILIDDEVEANSTLADDPKKDIYSGVLDLELDIGGHTYRKGNDYPDYVQIWNDENPDNFSAGGNTYDRPFYMGPGLDLSSFTVHLFDYSNTVFNSTSLPSALNILRSSENVLGEFDYKQLNFIHVSQGDGVSNQYLSMGGELQTLTVSPVPLPASAWLFGSALLGLIGWKRKSSATKRTSAT